MDVQANAELEIRIVGAANKELLDKYCEGIGSVSCVVYAAPL